MQVLDLSSYEHVPSAGRDYTPIFPLDGMIAGINVKTPALPAASAAAAPLVRHAPFVQLARVEELSAAGSSSSSAAGGKLLRLHMRTFSELPCWGILNITGTGEWVLGREVCGRCAGLFSCFRTMRWGSCVNMGQGVVLSRGMRHLLECVHAGLTPPHNLVCIPMQGSGPGVSLRTCPPPSSAAR